MEPYLRDASYMEGGKPIAVLIPKNVAEISKILKVCHENSVPVTVRGGGSSLTGSSVPIKNGIVLSMEKFNRIIKTEIEDRYIIVEPGIILDALNRHLYRFGYFYPPDPASSSIASVGGTISTNAGGLRAVMYGTTRDWILDLEVVLPSGDVIQTGSKTLKLSRGYDLTALMIGSEGTLGVITKATLKIWPLPKASGRLTVYYQSIANAGKAVGELKSNGLPVLIAEFLDESSMTHAEKEGHIRYPKNAKCMLIIDVATDKESLKSTIDSTIRILKRSSPILINATTNAKAMEKMYKIRKEIYNILVKEAKTMNQQIIIGDIVVPPSQLPGAMFEIERAIKKSGLRVVLFGHIGDGNIHSNIFADSKNAAFMRRVDRLQVRVGNIALAHEGSVSAEHGIGLQKKDLLIDELTKRNSKEAIKLMRQIKSVFDPKNILNPGKIFDV